LHIFSESGCCAELAGIQTDVFQVFERATGSLKLQGLADSGVGAKSV